MDELRGLARDQKFLTRKEVGKEKRVARGNPNPDTSGLIPVKPGDPGRNPNGSSKKARAQAEFFRMFGDEKVDKELALAMFAKAFDYPELLRDKSGRQRKPDLNWLKELREFAYGKDDDEEKKASRAEILDELRQLDDESGNSESSSPVQE
jgi:hypothetical protein